MTITRRTLLAATAALAMAASFGTAHAEDPTVPLALWCWPVAPVRPAAWAGFLYVSVFSVWLGFFAWYRGLQLGGMLRVSQVQLLQPFLSMALAVPLLEVTTPFSRCRRRGCT